MNNNMYNNQGVDLFKSIFDANLENVLKMKSETEKDALKNLFKNRIKISFLMKILNKIKKITNNYEDIKKYYPSEYNCSYYDILLGTENIEFDICNHIVGVHTYNMLLVEDYKRGAMQKDNKYIDDLINTVINQIKLRRYGSMLFRKRKLFNVDDYLYFPPVYNLHVLTIYLNDIHFEYENIVFSENINKEIDLFGFIISIISRTKGALAVLDYDSLECGYPIMRGIIELYLIYLAFKHSTASTKSFINFNEYKVIYDAYNEFHPDFEEMYQRKGKNINKIAYLNYGWLDDIFEFGYLGVKKTYTFSNIAELVDELFYRAYKIKYYGSNLKTYYEKCNYHTHASLFILKYPILYIMDFCKGIGEVITGIAGELNKIKKLPLYNDIDIVKLCEQSISKLHKIRSELKTEQLDLYYKNRAR